MEMTSQNSASMTLCKENFDCTIEQNSVQETSVSEIIVSWAQCPSRPLISSPEILHPHIPETENQRG